MTLRSVLVGVLACLLLITSLSSSQAQSAAKAAEAATLPPLNVAVFVSSRSDVCFDPGDVKAITAMTRMEQDKINRQGGIGGRPVALKFYDDARDAGRAVENLRQALADPDMVAMIGLSASTRAKPAFEANAKQIEATAIPFLSSISVNSIFAKYPNVFTMQASQDDERVPAMAEFIRHMHYRRPAFVGLGDVLFSTALGDGLKQRLGADTVVSDRRLATHGDALSQGDLDAAVADLRQTDPDMLVVAVGAARTPLLLNELIKANVTPALLVTGRIEALPDALTKSYPNAIYQLAWDGLPEAYNERMRRLVGDGNSGEWVFEGRKIDAAPGWASGACKPRAKDVPTDPLDAANLRAIEHGARFADMLALVATAARDAESGSDIRRLRREIVRKISTAYLAGRGAFKGPYDNWSFHAGSRAAMRAPFIVILPQGLGRTQLAPTQFVRLKDGVLSKIKTLYLDIDLIRAHRVDDNDKSFFAEFYLSMRNSGSIEQIEFVNAYLDPRTNGRQIAIETVHGGGASAAYPHSMRIYRVSGRFVYEPELTNYPFDTQRFAIDIQPKRGDAPFIVQPPPPHLRDQHVTTDGWTPKSQYVGHDEDFVPLIDAYTHEASVAPFYKTSFVWLMTRQTTDYYLRVVVPLGFILVIAYLSIFIPTTHFEAIVTIQVTALLSAVALYLSLPKLDADSATLSDRIFVFNYMLVSVMIAISILHVNRRVAPRMWLRATLVFVHIVGIPLAVAGAAYYVAMTRGMI